MLVTHPVDTKKTQNKQESQQLLKAKVKLIIKNAPIKKHGIAFGFLLDLNILKTNWKKK